MNISRISFSHNNIVRNGTRDILSVYDEYDSSSDITVDELIEKMSLKIKDMSEEKFNVFILDLSFCNIDDVTFCELTDKILPRFKNTKNKTLILDIRFNRLTLKSVDSLKKWTKIMKYIDINGNIDICKTYIVDICFEICYTMLKYELREFINKLIFVPLNYVHHAFNNVSAYNIVVKHNWLASDWNVNHLKYYRCITNDNFDLPETVFENDIDTKTSVMKRIMISYNPEKNTDNRESFKFKKSFVIDFSRFYMTNYKHSYDDYDYDYDLNDYSYDNGTCFITYINDVLSNMTDMSFDNLVLEFTKIYKHNLDDLFSKESLLVNTIKKFKIDETKKIVLFIYDCECLGIDLVRKIVDNADVDYIVQNMVNRKRCVDYIIDLVKDIPEIDAKNITRRFILPSRWNDKESINSYVETYPSLFPEDWENIHNEYKKLKIK